jgi:hypothetical protein
VALVTKIVSQCALSRQLSWSHFKELLPLNKEVAGSQRTGTPTRAAAEGRGVSTHYHPECRGGSRKERSKAGRGRPLFDCVARAAALTDLRQIMLLGKFLHMHLDGVAIGAR